MLMTCMHVFLEDVVHLELLPLDSVVLQGPSAERVTSTHPSSSCFSKRRYKDWKIRPLCNIVDHNQRVLLGLQHLVQNILQIWTDQV